MSIYRKKCLYIANSTCFEVTYLCIVLSFAHACSPALSTTKESTYIPRKKLLYSRIDSFYKSSLGDFYAHASYLACVLWVARYSAECFVEWRLVMQASVYCVRCKNTRWHVMHSSMAYPVYEAPQVLICCLRTLFLLGLKQHWHHVPELCYDFKNKNKKI